MKDTAQMLKFIRSALSDKPDSMRITATGSLSSTNKLQPPKDFAEFSQFVASFARVGGVASWTNRHLLLVVITIASPSIKSGQVSGSAERGAERSKRLVLHIGRRNKATFRLDLA